MASVAICPHCYLQLVVPDGVEPDEQVECPTCARGFSLDRAVLRAIPEVVRRGSTPANPLLGDDVAVPAEKLSPSIEEVEVVEQAAVESAEGAAPAANYAPTPDEAADYIETIKARIERELATGNLLPGMTTGLSLETPDSIELPTSPAATEPEPLDQWHRPTVRLNELTELEDEPHVSGVEDELEVSSIETASVIDEPSDELEVEAATPALPIEPTPARPAATTLADLMQRSDNFDSDGIHVDHVDEETADVPGPSFELPNVPLTPSRNATVEFDPAMNFGPASDSTFELDNVNFDSTSPEDSVTEDEVVESVIDEDEYVIDATDDDEVDSYEERPYEEESPAYEETSYEESSYDEEPPEYQEASTESDAPVFSDSPAVPAAAAPFILPGLPPRRKKRSVVRTLIGSAVGGVIGSAGAFYALLWILGPDGDFLQVAKYIPAAVLPKSFAAKPLGVVAQNAPTQPATTEPTDTESSTTEQGESEAVPATFTEEVKQPESETGADALAEETPTGDGRYNEEPSPLDEPAADPIAAAAPVAPLPIEGPTYTTDQLAAALDAATEAEPGLVTGDLSDAAVRRTKGMSYAKFCDLASALTFADRSAPSVESEQATAGAERLFRETLSDPHTRSEVDRIATLWIDSPHRRHGGVFLAGALSGGDIAGNIYEYELTTDGGGKLALLSAEPIDENVQVGQPVGIVGSIVAHPSSDVAGYQGTAERAIWVTRAIPLD